LPRCFRNVFHRYCYATPSKRALLSYSEVIQESRAVARKPRDAAAVLVGLQFANNIHYKFKSSHASFEPKLQSSKQAVSLAFEA